MKENLKAEIKDYVDDWHWDDASEKYAFDLGKFLFSFIHYLKDQKMTERTLKNHEDNLYFIGAFEAGYGYNEEFHPENLEGEPNFVYQFERKVSDSKYAINSYKATWRKLDKYIQSGKYKSYMEALEKEVQ